MKYLITIILFSLLASCSKKAEQAKNDKGHDAKVVSHDTEHSHNSPNGGELTELGEHEASLEWLIEEGQIKIYIFDGCAEKPIRIAQKEIKVTVKADNETQLTLIPLTNKLTGEKPGDSNTFSASVKDLKQEKISAINVHSLSIKGIDYINVKLKVE